MSIFQQSTQDVKRDLQELPSHHSKQDIVRLIDGLQADIKNDPPGLSFTEKAKKHADQHKELFFSYPMLYRTICKGTYRRVVLDILLDAKEAIESGQKTKKEALEDVIKEAVDEVNHFRRNNSS
jgi:hypothetical protein